MVCMVVCNDASTAAVKVAPRAEEVKPAFTRQARVSSKKTAGSIANIPKRRVKETRLA